MFNPYPQEADTDYAKEDYMALRKDVLVTPNGSLELVNPYEFYRPSKNKIWCSPDIVETLAVTGCDVRNPDFIRYVVTGRMTYEAARFALPERHVWNATELLQSLANMLMKQKSGENGVLSAADANYFFVAPEGKADIYVIRVMRSKADTPWKWAVVLRPYASTVGEIQPLSHLFIQL